jgi:hypothetical protein
MNREELKLSMAVFIWRQNEQYPSRDLVYSDERRRVCLEIRSKYDSLFQTIAFPYSEDDILRTMHQVRKNKDTEIKAEIAILHGYACFWEHRGKGDCSDELEAGHIIPASDGAPLTVENGMIECRYHNNQRRTQTIEEYLRDGFQQRTDEVEQGHGLSGSVREN